VQKSEFEEFIDNLLSHVKNNNVSELRNTLDKGIRTGFDIDSVINSHWNLLYYACCYCHPETVQFLTEERGCNLDLIIDGETALMIACSSSQNSDEMLEVIKILHTKEPKLINRTNYMGENALMLATKRGHLAVIEYLIKIGESYDIINNSGRNVSTVIKNNTFVDPGVANQAVIFRKIQKKNLEILVAKKMREFFSKFFVTEK
jgi:ankyrin repeat protein